MRVDVWSDVVCPWCYVGKRRLEAALAMFAHKDAVEVEWHAFELDPSATDGGQGNYAARLGKKYGMDAAKAQAMIDGMTETAKKDGLDFRFDRVRPGNTFDAHRVIHFAAREGRGDAMKERLLLAYMTEGESIADRETLVRLAEDVGLEGERVRAMLASDELATAVREDEKAAAAMGVRGVPFFVVDETYGVSGAQPAELLLEVLEKAWNESHAGVTMVAEGQVCEDGSCG